MEKKKENKFYCLASIKRWIIDFGVYINYQEAYKYNMIERAILLSIVDVVEYSLAPLYPMIHEMDVLIS